MNQETFEKLQFNRVKEEVKLRATGDYTKQRIEKLQPQTSLAVVEVWQKETFEARQILESSQHVPFMALQRIDYLIGQVKRGMILTAGELVECADFLRSGRLMGQFFFFFRYQMPLLFQYSQALPDLTYITERIEQQIQNQRVSDNASAVLRKARRKVAELEGDVQDRLLKFLRNPQHKEWIQEFIVVKKGESYTIPIKASFKNRVAGSVVEQSNKGTTVFMEPSVITKQNEKLELLHTEIQIEEYQILAELTGLLAEAEHDIQELLEVVSAFDFIFARAKYSCEIQGETPLVNKNEKIIIKKGRHPFLSTAAVPLDFELGTTARGLVITGANAGGKTVVLKTVGLFTLMAMFGLQIPAASGSEIAVMDHIFVDIGDQQNIENALSTFSGHMHNLAGILNQTGRNTLVLLDEIGSGTEPNEGAALAIAIMEDLYQKGALIVATTHYGEIKRFAQEHADFTPAAMAFDRETLMPQFILHMGETGDSQALWIAKKMHMNKPLIQKAQSYIEHKEYSQVKKEFSATGVKREDAEIAPPNLFARGDRVLLTEEKIEALVFLDEGKAQVEIYADGKTREVPRKRLKLLAKAQDLYPDGYDLDTLFSDYQTRKTQRDLNRGSKTAQKQLDKERRARLAENQSQQK